LWRRLLQFLGDLAIKKQWLRQECGWLLYTSVGYLRSTTTESDYALSIIQSLEANKLILTPEGVAIWLEVRSLYPDTHLAKNIWKHRDPLHRHEPPVLAQIMKDARANDKPASEQPNPPQSTGTWSQHLHFSWNVLLRELYRSSDGAKDASSKRMTFAVFWRDVVGGAFPPTVTTSLVFPRQDAELICVTESLLVPTSSPERKHSALSLLTQTLTSAPPSLLHYVFTPKITSLLVTYLKEGERYLHRSATRTVEALHMRAAKEPSIITNVLQGLVLGASGVHNFDTVSKTKTVRKLLIAANLATCNDLVSAVAAALVKPQSPGEKDADAKRRSLTDMLVALYSRSLSTGTEHDIEPAAASRIVAEMVLDILVAMGYSQRSSGSKGMRFEPQVTVQCRSYVQSRIRTCLDQSLHDSEDKLHLLRYTVDGLKAIQTKGSADAAFTEFDAETQDVVDKAWKGLGKMRDRVSQP
jgi:DNA polymerase phi